MSNQIYDILNDMSPYLNISQMKKLQETLIFRLAENNASETLEQASNIDYMNMYLSAEN